MTDDEIAALLATPEIGVLATAYAQGRPEGSPVWFDYVDGVVRVLVHRDSRKARNIRENAHVSFTVDTRRAPYRGVVLRGTADALFVCVLQAIPHGHDQFQNFDLRKWR